MAHSALSKAGHIAREAAVRIHRVSLPRLPRSVMLFPSTVGSGSASDLRAFAIAPKLLNNGWRAFCVPPQLELQQRHRLIAMEKPDILLFQQTRHPLNDPALYPGHKTVLDVDDADILDARHTQRIAACAKQADAVIVGSRHLGDLFKPYNARIHVIWTSTYLRPDRERPIEKRPNSIVWGPSGAFGYPMEMQFVIDVVTRLVRKRRDFDFHIYGVEDEYSTQFDELVAGLRKDIVVTPHRPMPYRKFVQELSKHTIGLQPIAMENVFSRGKSFGKVLAYLLAGLAVIATNELEHGEFFKHGDNGFLLEPDPQLWANSCEGLLEDRGLLTRVAHSGERSLLERLTDDRFAEKLSQFLNQLV